MITETKYKHPRTLLFTAGRKGTFLSRLDISLSRNEGNCLYVYLAPEGIRMKESNSCLVYMYDMEEGEVESGHGSLAILINLAIPPLHRIYVKLFVNDKNAVFDPICRDY